MAACPMARSRHAPRRETNRIAQRGPPEYWVNFIIQVDVEALSGAPNPLDDRVINRLTQGLNSLLQLQSLPLGLCNPVAGQLRTPPSESSRRAANEWDQTQPEQALAQLTIGDEAAGHRLLIFWIGPTPNGLEPTAKQTSALNKKMPDSSE